MKILKLSLAAFLISASTLLVSCNDSNTSHPNDETKVDMPDSSSKGRETANNEKKSALNDVYDKYIDIKDALYSNDADKVKSYVGDMKKELDNVKTSDLQPADVEEWNKMAGQLREPLNKMEAAKDIKEQRIEFAVLSESMIAAVKKMGLNNKTTYVQHCPMAKTHKGEGADWLSQKEKVENPYYGDKDKMSACGETTEPLKYE